VGGAPEAGAGMGGAEVAGAAGSLAGGGSGGSGGATLSFARDIFPVYDQIRDPYFVYPGGSLYEGCTTTGVCHGGTRAGAGLVMTDAETAYDMLLGVPSVSTLCNDTVRVVPGNPEESCLILFYEGRLRDELDWVDDQEIDLTREWIRQGAAP
jgi:hypothetical protein